MLIGSLCSGYGGLDLAAQDVLDADPGWHAETDPAPSCVLAAHWPGVPNLGDITTIDWDQVEPVDILTAGYPCQPFSHAGRRKGTDDERHLWPHVAEAIRRIRPRLVVLENVAGHRSMGFGDVLADLAAAGYDAQWTSVRASDVGAPHRRERLFIVATDAERLGRSRWSPDAGRDEVVGAAATRPSAVIAADTRGEHGEQRRPAASGEAASGRSLSQLAGRDRVPAGVGGVEHARCCHNGCSGIHESVAFCDGRHHCDAADADRSGSQGRDEHGHGPDQRAARSPSVGTIADADRDAIRQQPITEPGRGGPTIARHAGVDASPDADRDGRESLRRVDTLGRDADRRDSPHVEWGRYEPAIQRWEHVLGRPAPLPTEPGARGGQRLSPRFVEWMMGLPAGWVTDVPGISRNDQLKMLGNGVVPQQATAALIHLLIRQLAPHP